MKTWEVLLVPTPAASQPAGTAAATYNLLPMKHEPDHLCVKADYFYIFKKCELRLAVRCEGDEEDRVVAVFHPDRWIVCLAVHDEREAQP